MLDSIIGLTLLAMGAASFYSLFPVVSRAHAIGDQEQKATQLATKMIEHIQLLSPGKLTSTYLSGMQLIDSGQSASPYTFTNCPLDSGTDYCPSKALKNGTGTLTITDKLYGAKQVVVTISWKSVTGKSESVTMGTILGNHRS